MLLWQLKLYLSPQTVEVPIRKLLPGAQCYFCHPFCPLLPPAHSAVLWHWSVHCISSWRAPKYWCRGTVMDSVATGGAS